MCSSNAAQIVEQFAEIKLAEACAAKARNIPSRFSFRVCCCCCRCCVAVATIVIVVGAGKAPCQRLWLHMKPPPAAEERTRVR